MAPLTADLVLSADAIRLGGAARDRADAIDQCGRLLVELGAVDPGYVAAMHEREASISTFMGEGVAIPHGTDASRSLVRETALAFVQFPEGVDWGGPTAHVAIAIAASGEEHLKVLASLAGVLADPERSARLRVTTDPDEVLELLAPTAD